LKHGFTDHDVLLRTVNFVLVCVKAAMQAAAQSTSLLTAPLIRGNNFRKPLPPDVHDHNCNNGLLYEAQMQNLNPWVFYTDGGYLVGSTSKYSMLVQ